jgi:2-polyprenyl-3-methyl-5-hydroxy-6-metoxy-1,4-benzoquinol methylase
MAIDSNFARFLIACHQDGVNFQKTLTLGRLNYYLSIKETRNVLRRTGLDEHRYPDLLNYETSRYAETFFKAMGAEKVESMDASNFENATIVHDLNQPIPNNLKGTFDVVCDGGTIEHVLNFPIVIRNCMEMVKIGGHLIIGTPANNNFGHGFYQFSPELWFRLLSPMHGFESKRMVAVEYGPRSRWYEVADPEMVRERVVMTNRYPVSLMIVSRKTAEKPIFQNFPQQSDYVPRWQGDGDPASRRKPIEVRVRRIMLETFPGLVRALENIHRCSWLNRRHSLSNRRFFKPVKR